MPVTHPELQLEQHHVDAAYAALERARSRAREGEVDAAAADPTISRSAHLDREALLETFLRRAARLRTGDQPLVFGRIDTDGESLHIGRLGLAGESGNRLVVDWRTAVAEPFYRATPLDTLGLRRRRHLHCRGSRVVGLDDDFFDDVLRRDDLVLVGEAALLAAMMRSRTGRMRNIVPTIQREQDAIIRAPLDQTLVVQGGPGTGKTVVALHRAAFLLYTYRQRLKGRPVLVVGPNPLFLRYIEDVLPELGEDQVRLATAGELVDGVSVNGIDSADVTRLKGDPRMVAVIARVIEQRRRGLRKDVVVWHDSQPLHLDAAESAAMVAAVAARGEPHNTGRRELHKALLRRLYDVYCDMAADAGAGSVTERVPFYEDVAHQPRVVAALDEMWPLLAPATVVGDLLRDGAVLAAAAEGVLDEDEVALLAAAAEPGAVTAADVALLDEADAQLGPRTVRRKAEQSEARAALLREIEQQAIYDAGDVGYLAYDPDLKEDVLDVVRARFAADFPEPAEEGEALTFGHVVVDEAQDLSPMQWRMLGRRCPSGSMTIVGDLQQAFAGSGAGSWEAALAHLPSALPRATATLSVNYRTPAEIMAVAGSLVRDDGRTPHVRSVRESGRQPRFVATSAAGLRDAVREAVVGIRDDVGEGRVAVIHPASMRALVRDLVPHPHDPAAALDAEVAAFTVDEVRGLEFDGVVVVEPTAIAAEHRHGRHALYVAVTRAVQELRVVHTTSAPWP